MGLSRRRNFGHEQPKQRDGQDVRKKDQKVLKSKEVYKRITHGTEEKRREQNILFKRLQVQTKLKTCKREVLFSYWRITGICKLCLVCTSRILNIKERQWHVL